MKKKRMPARQCLGCRQMFDKRELVRVVRSKEGGISLDTTGKKPGRGAYVCRSMACLQKAKRSRALERAFACEVQPSVYEALEAEMGDMAVD